MFCEDKLPSRFDFGKSKYGGPFTTEQVEDVKTFLRMSVILIFCSLFPGEAFIVYKHSNKLINLISHRGNRASECFITAIDLKSGILLWNDTPTTP